MVITQKKESLFTFWKRTRFEGGERENDLSVHVHCITSHSSLIFFSLFFFVFLSYLFSSSFYSVFSFYSINALFFHLFLRARQGPFYSACHDQSFTILPFNHLCLVWACLLTTKFVRHSPLLDRGRFVSFLSLR